MLPISEALIAAVVSPGESVLDVACGTGIATRLAAEAVGPDGRVAGTDLNPGMLAFARSASAKEWPEISWEQASALDLPYESGSFDRVICQQGVQFFSDPAAGLRELARVARPGGSVAVTVWAELSTSPYFEALAEMLIQFAKVDPAEISFAGTESQLTGWFDGGGLRPPTIELVEVPIDLPPMLEYVPQHLKALPWAPAFAELDVPTREAGIAYIEDRMKGHRTREGVTSPFGSYLAHGCA